MSYILEALKKAEAERNGNALPVAPAAPVFIRAEAERAASRSARRWWWAGVPVAMLAAGAAWLTLGTGAPPAPQQTASSTAQPAVVQDKLAQASPPSPPRPATPAAAPAAAGAPMEAPAAPPTASAPSTPSPSFTPPATPERPQEEKPVAPAKEKPPRKASDRPLDKPVDKSVEKPTDKPVEKKRAAKEDAKPAAAPEPQVAGLRELPEHIQREIPAYTVGGYIYSANKADRTVLINKRLLREGDEVAPGLVLERMQPSGMVLNYKGYRYRTGY